MDRFASASLVKALSRSYWHARWRIGNERARCLHKYLSFDVRYCQSTRIQFDWGEFPVFREIFPAEQSVRECKAVNLSNWNNEWNDWRWRGAVFLMAKIFPNFLFSLSAFIFHFSHLLSHSAMCIFIANAMNSFYFHSAKRMRTTVSSSSEDDRKGGWRGRCREKVLVHCCNFVRGFQIYWHIFSHRYLMSH